MRKGSRASAAAVSAEAENHPVGALCGILAAALVLRLLYFAQSAGDIFTRRLIIDAQFYDQWALRILGGDWLGRGRVFYQDPLYAYFLAGCYAVFGHHPQLVRLIQIGLDAGTILALYALSAFHFGRRAGLIAAALASLYGPMVYYTCLLDKTTVSTFLTAAALAVFALASRRRDWRIFGFSGLGLGLACLTRGNLLLVAAALSAWLWLRKAGVRQVAAFAGGTALIVGMSAARNAWAGRDFVLLTSNSGFNFYLGNNAHTAGSYVLPPAVRGIPEFEYQDSKAFAEYLAGRPLIRASQVSTFFLKQGRDFILQRPDAWLALVGRKIFLMFNALEEVDTYSFYYYKGRYAWLRAAFLNFGWISPLGLLGFVLPAVSARSHAWNELHVFFLAYAASLAAVFVTSRYRFPLAVSMIPFAAGALDGWVRGPSSPRAWAIRLVPFGILAWAGQSTPAWMRGLVLSAQSTGHTLAGYEYAMGEANFSAAIAEYDAAIRVDPTAYLNYLYTAEARLRMGDEDGALENYLHAVRLDPACHEAWNNIGVQYYRRGRYKEALEAFQSALRTKPYDPQYQSNARAAAAALSAIRP